MYLTGEENEMLDGKRGYPLQKSMGIQERLIAWKPPKVKYKKGLLARISNTMLPVEKGAILRRNF